MNKLIHVFTLIFFCHYSQAGGVTRFNWITGNDGSWFNSNNWVEGAVPFDDLDVRFGVGDNDNSIDQVDIDNFSNGINSPNTLLRLERKVVFSDTSAAGNPLLADDGMTFDRMQINGSGGSGVVFNVPVSADTMTSNRHGGIFNREITVNTILATSSHQDRWQINASATVPIRFLLIDENRGPDGGDVNGAFTINSDLQIINVEHVWGRLRIGVDAFTEIDSYLYFDYTKEAENNSINPIVINGTLSVDVFNVYDFTNDSIDSLEVGSYGSLGNKNADFQVDFITGDGLLIVNLGDQIFKDSFDELICNFKSDSFDNNRGCL